MSGFGPLAAFAAQVLANANAAIEQATLDLGIEALEIQAQINVGDVIVATVLPAAGDGVDRISLLGQTVPAQLPPGINPGESIAVQVTGFTNTAILVRNLGPVDPDNPPSPVDLPVPSTPQAALPAQTAVLTTRYPATASAAPGSSTASASPATAPPVSTPVYPASPAASPQPPSAASPGSGAPLPVAPPREFFVAASVREGSVPIPPGLVSEEAPLTADLEARIALNRTGSSPPPPSVADAAARASSSGLAARPPATPAPLTGRTSVPPIITPSRAVAAQGADRAPIAAQAPVQVAPRPATPESALLTRLGIPISATTLLAARGVNSAAQSVSSSYQKLEALLASLPADDRTNSLRSALAFVAKFDMRNVRTLPEQIASFVSNVVDGAESKIAQIVRAWSASAALAAETEAEAQPETQPPPNAQPAPGTPSQAPAAAAVPAVPTDVVARSAERMVALEHDVKAAILALIENPPAGTSPQLATALREALTATNALQFGVLASRTNDANTITIPLPAYFYDGGKPAQIRISRDLPGGKGAMDADNFHVSFILDTKSLGTVGIDLQTVGRSVSIDVKTQASLAADRFRTTLGDLRSRLEQLHYRVATMAANVVTAPLPEMAETPIESPAPTTLDMRA
jgi:hypothetical protein